MGGPGQRWETRTGPLKSSGSGARALAPSRSRCGAGRAAPAHARPRPARNGHHPATPPPQTGCCGSAFARAAASRSCRASRRRPGARRRAAAAAMTGAAAQHRDRLRGQPARSHACSRLQRFRAFLTHAADRCARQVSRGKTHHSFLHITSNSNISQMPTPSVTRPRAGA